MLNETNDPAIQPGVIPLHQEGPDDVVVADPSTVFDDRARRFDHFAARDDGQRTFHAFLAALSRAQHRVASTLAPRGLPDAALVAQRRAHRMPVLPAGLVERDATWLVALRGVLAEIDDRTVPVAAQAARRALQGLADDVLDRLGGQLLAFDYETLSPEVVPWLAAGLQVWWVVAVGRVAVPPPCLLDTPTLCPCCGSPPVASVRRIGGKRQGVRFLACSLCATEWHLVRVKCSHCLSTKGIGYLSLSLDPDSEVGRAAATRDTVKAEVCDECSGYLKLVNLESDATADVVADDFATLALDVLTDERGYRRIGPNLFIHPGVAA